MTNSCSKHINSSQLPPNKIVSQRLFAMTLIEVIISLALISIAFLSMFSAINRIYKANLYIDDRLAIRDQTSFLIRYIKARLQVANPESVDCNPVVNGNTTQVLSWQSINNTQSFKLFKEQNVTHPYLNTQYTRLSLEIQQNDDTKSIILTYPNMNVKSVSVTCDDIFNDDVTLLSYKPVTIVYSFESTKQLGDHPLVQDVVKYLNVLVVN